MTAAFVPRSATQERLEEVRAAAGDVLAFAAELDEAGLLALPASDRRTFRALRDALIEIGETVRALPPDIFSRHPAVDWRGWASLGEVVPRRHLGPELHRMHPVIVDDLPALVAAVEAELVRPAGKSLDGGTPGAAQ